MQTCRKVEDNLEQGLVVEDGWIYYINKSDGGKLYKVKTDGIDKTKLTDDKIKTFNVSNGFMYTVEDIESQRLYKMKTDGTEKTKMNAIYPENITIVGDWIYYDSYYADYYEKNKVKLDGNGKSQKVE